MGVVFITGTGIVTGLGYGKERTMEALRQHKSAVGKVRYLPTEHVELPVSEVPFSNDEMKQMLDIQQDTALPRTVLIGRLALKEALEEAHLNPKAQRTAFINGTTVGGMDRTENFENNFIKTHDCGACTELIAQQTDGFCFVTTMSTACSSTANAILLGKELIETGKVDVAVVGGAECITKYHLNGFNTLMILDKKVCRPFDKTRAGLNLGEGAGYIVLESEQSCKRRNIKPLAILSGAANRCDAFHQTATSPDGEGSFLAMTDALKDAGLKPDDIDYINAHGTGTSVNDMSEGMAIMRVFGEKVPPVASVKGYIGHTTSAAGGVEAVISVLALTENYMPISLNFNEKIEELGFEPIHKETRHNVIRHVMSNSFGFGGNDTVCIFSAVRQDEVFRQDEQDLHDVSPINFDNSSNSDIAHLSSLISNPKIRIAAAAQISMQNPFCDDWFEKPISYEKESLVKAQDPDYKPFINPMAARRMGHLLKRAIATSKTALNEAKIEMPDAIITASGMGCLENTEKFLNAMTEQGESCLQPTFFINSTHNTIGSTIAILTKNHGYNNTHVHQGTSFESALLDAMLQFEEGKIKTALVGAFDEMTEQFYNYGTAQLFKGENDTTGETAVSFVLNTEKGIEIAGIDILHNPDFQEITNSLNNICNKKNMTINDIDFLVTGRNSNQKNNVVWDKFEKNSHFEGKSGSCKDIFGESFTSSAMSFYFAFECLKRGVTPNGIKVNNILIYNHFNNIDHSLILLTK